MARLTISKLRDLLNDLENPNPRGRVLVPWMRDSKEVEGFHVDEDGNLVLELRQGIIKGKKEEK